VSLPLQTHLGGKVSAVSRADVRIKLEVARSIIVVQQHWMPATLLARGTGVILLFLPLLTSDIIFIL
jgi:hypothetical protein